MHLIINKRVINYD